MDAGVGRVLEALKQHPDTFVIFTSDNGGQVEVGGTNGTLRGGKQNMYEGGIRVPCVAQWPGHIKPGSESDAALQVSDLYQTVLKAEFPPPRETLVFVRREGGRPYFGQDYYAIRKGEWKLLQNTPFQPYELYNLKTDPRETNNMIASDPKIAAELIKALEAHIIQVGQVPWSPKR
jgi:arylsulfatase A-like enzyme